jgi:hypothetical protein
VRARQTSPADRGAGVPDEIREALHGLNNALAVAIGRLEICEDCLDDVMHGQKDAFRESLHESQRGLLRARDHAIRIAALALGTRS